MKFVLTSLFAATAMLFTACAEKTESTTEPNPEANVEVCEGCEEEGCTTCNVVDEASEVADEIADEAGEVADEIADEAGEVSDTLAH